jgi:cholesterol oxidase
MVGTQVSYDYDCIVVGSGFGASAVACRVAEGGRRVLVLERGDRYPPGTFPRTTLGSSTNVWDPSAGLFGLFDIWSFRKFEAVVSSGLGGGSLIYANVMLRKPAEWFVQETTGEHAEYWPVTAADLDESYRRAEEMLGVTPYPYVDTTTKAREFRDAAQRADLAWRVAPLAVSFSPPGEPPGMPLGQCSDNLHGVPRTTCRLCGECDIGCNYGSKNTTDLTYLSVAARHEAEVRVLHEVRQIRQLPDGQAGYRVTAVQHAIPEPRWDRTGPPSIPEPRAFTARTVVLGAGSLGSSYLLLRNRVFLPRLSSRLGTKFCGNGDYLGFVSSGETRVLNSTSGPVITSYIYGLDDLDGAVADAADPGERGFIVQEGGYPTVADWLSEFLGLRPVSRVAKVLTQLARARLTDTPRTEISALLSEAIGDARRSRGILPMLGMGRDLPGGRMTLRDGYLQISWNTQYSRRVFRRIQAAMRQVAEQLDGRFLQGPSSLLSRMVTVHPLGGVPMGVDANHGVVDSYGEVFGYPGLFVSDGSVMPGPVGVNPSLTIAALGERFSERVLDRTGAPR